MKKIILITAVFPMLLTACTKQDNISYDDKNTPQSEAVTAYIQEIEHLHPDDGNKSYTPLNYDQQIGMWFPYMHYEKYMQGKSAEEFRSAVRELYTSAKSQSVNTVYLHVHPCGDAYYKSDIFPKGIILDGDYDPLQIMLEEAHSLELSVHAWINPLRFQSTEQMSQLSDDFIVKKWTETPDCGIVRQVNGRWYLNPAYNEVAELISSGVEEILSRYEVDGIHIDDYFYPTTDPEFDKAEFEKSGSSDLAKWRMENCTRFVKAIYDTVKEKDKRILFGISPQGSINGNYNSQYADVRLWGGTKGYCDYIVPQIYFGFKNESSPFDKTLAEWEALTNDDISLIIGLGAYKIGKSDKWAGAGGEQEWIDDPNIIEKQIELVKKSTANGYSLYY